MTYIETKKEINKIRRKDEIMFRMAISHLMEVGFRHLTEENINHCCEEMMKDDDSKAFMTNEYKCDLVRMAGQLTKFDHIYLLTYIGREVYYDVGDNGIDYKRTIDLLKKSMECICENTEGCKETLWAFEGLGFTDDELETLGYKYLLDIKEEDE